MTFIRIWSLKRGCILPAEPVDAITSWKIEREYRLASLERDPWLTPTQYWREELGRRNSPSERKANAAKPPLRESLSVDGQFLNNAGAATGGAS